MGFSAPEDLGCRLSWEAPLCPLGGCSREPSFSLLEGILYGVLSQDRKSCQGWNVEVNICHWLSGPSVGSLSYVTATRQIRLACQVLWTYFLAVSRCQLFFPFLSTGSSVHFSGPFSLLSLEERFPVAASSSSKKRKGLGHALGICDRRPGKRTWGLKRWAGPSRSCPCLFYSHSEWAVEILSLAWFYPLKVLWRPLFKLDLKRSLQRPYISHSNMSFTYNSAFYFSSYFPGCTRQTPIAALGMPTCSHSLPSTLASSSTPEMMAAKSLITCGSTCRCCLLSSSSHLPFLFYILIINYYFL